MNGKFYPGYKASIAMTHQNNLYDGTDLYISSTKVQLFTKQNLIFFNEVGRWFKSDNIFLE